MLYQIVNRLQNEFIKGYAKTFWANLDIITDTWKYDLFALLFQDKLIGFACIEKGSFKLQIISIFEEYQKKGYASALLAAIKMYYLLYRINFDDPRNFYKLKVGNITSDSFVFWYKLKNRFEWI